MMGLFLEDVEAGMNFDLGAYNFTAENIRSFSTRFVPVGFHMDSDLAAEGFFGGQVAAGWHICCGWMNCFVAKNMKECERVAASGQSLPEIGPSPGFSAVRWPSPVHAGDNIHYDVAVTAKRALKSRPEWGMVSIEARGATADGTIVMAFSGNVMVARRPMDIQRA